MIHDDRPAVAERPHGVGRVGRHDHHHARPGHLGEAVDGHLQLAQVAGPGLVVIVPANAPHAGRALSDGRAIIVDHPLRFDVG